MRVAFVSNFINHHQISLCRYLYEKCEEFYFIETMPMPIEQIKLGYYNYSNEPFVCKMYENASNQAFAESVIKEFDAVIFGACKTEYIDIRMKNNKLSFIFSERLWKKGLYRRFIPTTHDKVKRRFLRYKDHALYVLCASAYLPFDLQLIKFPKNKCYRWGYFPPTDREEFKQIEMYKPTTLRIIWCGRFIPLKRMQDSLRAISMLKKAGYDFIFDIIGSGPQREDYENYIRKNKLGDRAHLLGSMKADDVREEMKKADVLLFNSNYSEGWGAVINEAMNSGCVPVVSHAVGSANMLIQNGVNGYIYNMGHYKDLYRTLKYAIDKQTIQSCRKNAYDSIVGCWNGEEAGKRLVNLINAKLNRSEEVLYESGPCSLADVIKNNWFKEKVWKE